MYPEWDDSDTINRAIELIGVPHPKTGDRLALIGFADIRDNEDILQRIASTRRGQPQPWGRRILKSTFLGRYPVPLHVQTNQGGTTVYFLLLLAARLPEKANSLQRL